MTRQSFSIVLTFLVTTVFSVGIHAERYIVTDDAFGNADAKQLSQLEPGELEALEDAVEPSDDAKSKIEIEQPPSTSESNSDISAQPTSTPQVSDTAPTQVAVPASSTTPINSVETEATSNVSEESLRAQSVDESVASGVVTSILIDEPNSDSEAPTETVIATSSQLDENRSSLPLPESLSASARSETRASALSPIDQVTNEKENPFERALRESQANETDEVVKRLRAQGGDDRFDATKVNPADFVDSEDLIQGNVNSEGERPFFVTFDGDGDSNVIFYSPQVIQDEIDRREVEEVLSDAVAFTPEDARNLLTLPEGADPVAAQILSSGYKKSYFERFTDRCCEGLPNVGVLPLRLDKGLHVPLDRDDFSYRFADGDSRYQLVRLPDVRKNYLLTIKTFVRSYKKLGIDHGAFIPQVVLLDRDKRVTRILSQLSSDSHAETWSTYGYLKSVIEVEQGEIDYDAFLLVYTRASDLRQVSTIEDSSGAWEIKHMEIGSLEVAVVENSL